MSGFLGALIMANPWDLPPIPSEGDATMELTYAGVGFVMSHWENVEVTLSHLYSHFVGKEYQAEAMHEYGTPSTFKEGRLQKLIGAAERYLRDQQMECEFYGLATELIGYANRRNDVAHGVVRSREWWFQPVKTDVWTYWLVPAHYQPKRAAIAPNSPPTYAYTRPLMDDLGQKLLALNHRIRDLTRSLFPPRVEWVEFD